MDVPDLSRWATRRADQRYLNNMVIICVPVRITHKGVLWERGWFVVRDGIGNGRFGMKGGRCKMDGWRTANGDNSSLVGGTGHSGQETPRRSSSHPDFTILQEKTVMPMAIYFFHVLHETHDPPKYAVRNATRKVNVLEVYTPQLTKGRLHRYLHRVTGHRSTAAQARSAIMMESIAESASAIPVTPISLQERTCFGVTEPNILLLQMDNQRTSVVAHGLSRAYHLVQIQSLSDSQLSKGLTLLYTDIARGKCEGSVEARPIEKMGGRSVDAISIRMIYIELQVFFNKFKVPVSDRVREEGDGFKIILRGMNTERILLIVRPTTLISVTACTGEIFCTLLVIQVRAGEMEVMQGKINDREKNRT
ncbi:hypothetical protein BD410DRAFT_808881 [Rickenella mellea]|uniref:Uncharacterized protein n=1 Tax=Rickenella mellea TaxID=50990 RepID=A0A4Y7PJ95_9AGAM|nr:hypothetical protein BD410DRAFT_808881 [Rickenella mellea]